MYKFLYNKTCNVIEKIIFWAQIIVGVLLITGIICLCIGTAKIVWTISAILWWVVVVFEGCSYLYKAKIITLPVNTVIETDKKTLLSLLKDESAGQIVVKLSHTALHLQKIAVSTKKDELIYSGLIKIFFGLLMIACFLI